MGGALAPSRDPSLPPCGSSVWKHYSQALRGRGRGGACGRDSLRWWLSPAGFLARVGVVAGNPTLMSPRPCSEAGRRPPAAGGQAVGSERPGPAGSPRFPPAPRLSWHQPLTTRPHSRRPRHRAGPRTHRDLWGDSTLGGTSAPFVLCPGAELGRAGRRAASTYPCQRQGRCQLCHPRAGVKSQCGCREPHVLRLPQPPGTQRRGDLGGSGRSRRPAVRQRGDQAGKAVRSVTVKPSTAPPQTYRPFLTVL